MIKLTRNSVPAVLGLLVYFLIVGLLIERIRYVMGDEAAYLDPAINLVTGRGFTSTAWPQHGNQFWAGNVPLHAFLSAGWMTLFGPTLAAGRMLSLCLFAAAIVLLLRASERHRLLTTAPQKFLFVTLVLLGLYSTVTAQFARPDALCLLILAYVFWSLAIGHPRVRRINLFVGGFLAMAAGLQLVVIIAVLGVLTLIFTKGRMFRDLVACACGGVGALAALYFLYRTFGVWDEFVRMTLRSGPNRVQWHGWRDPTLWACIGTMTILWPYAKDRSLRRILTFGLLAGLGVPAVLFALSKFPQYYAVFGVVPTALAASAVLPDVFARLPLILRLGVAGALTSACLIGFPVRLLILWNEWHRYDPAKIEAFCEPIGPKETVFCDAGIYFSVKHRAGRTVTQFYLRTIYPDEVRSIGQVVLGPGDEGVEVRRALGGQWAKVAELDLETAEPARFSQLEFLSRLSFMRPPKAERWIRTEPSS